MSIEALESSVYSFSSDIFSFGVVLYEMLHK
jgi:serine/threonine protein kinase